MPTKDTGKPMDFENLHQILRSLYDEMMPLCEDMAGVATGC